MTAASKTYRVAPCFGAHCNPTLGGCGAAGCLLAGAGAVAAIATNYYA